MLRLTGALVGAVCVALLISSCGGGDGPDSDKGDLSVTVSFAPDNAAVSPSELPVATNSVVIEVLDNLQVANPPRLVPDTIINRAAGAGGPVSCKIESIRPGQCIVRAKGYDGYDGQGTLIATGSAQATIRARRTTTLAFTTEALVVQITIVPAALQLEPGHSSFLTATAYDADGQVVLTTLTWDIAPGGGTHASVDASGLVTAQSVGASTVSATDATSGCQGSCAVDVVTSVDYSIAPIAMTVTVPPNSTNGTRDGLSKPNAYWDDIYLETITFTSGTFTQSQLREVLATSLTFGRAGCRADYGDMDTDSDGDPNPYVRAGVPEPPITYAEQDAAITAALSTFSISEGIAEMSHYGLNVMFDEGVADNDPARDGVPEIILVERNVAAEFQIEAIVGGTVSSPDYAPNCLQISGSEFWVSPYWIDTVGGPGQVLAAVGFDISDFGMPAGQPIYGLRFTSFSGADITGFFLSSTDPSRFCPLPGGLTPAP